MGLRHLMIRLPVSQICGPDETLNAAEPSLAPENEARRHMRDSHRADNTWPQTVPVPGPHAPEPRVDSGTRPAGEALQSQPCSLGSSLTIRAHDSRGTLEGQADFSGFNYS
ncbi:hypothetical protein AAFF_G00423590 [Aldrovandia affinis]|uniref:Uncharacterized protein n=1 Tax=Aldrovandia affinis TaxID=143900 RepID=A0AAD7X0Y1_9TELE|nr:hypothetical protein AAFF_G00423590 [Aldrovandia affinis]